MRRYFIPVQLLEQIYECFSTNAEGVPLAELISRAGTNFTKNDVYVGILRRDLHVPLSDCLLVDDRTTRVFSSEVHAEAYRLLNYQPKPTSTKPLVVKQGTRLRWNGTDYTVCNASPAKIYLQPKTGAPIPMHRQFFASLLQEADIVLLDEAAPFPTVQDEGPQNQRLVLSSAKIVKGHRKKQFLEFLAYNTNARPDTFALPSVSRRTIQRWQSAADHSQEKYGTPIWGLIERPRPGRPRDELPAEMRAEMTAIANELYFSKEERSVCFVWRVLRKRREARGLLCPSKGALRRHINKLKNLEESTALRKGKGASYKYTSAEVVGKNWATTGDFPLKTAQMDGKTLDVVVVDDETGQPLGKPTLTLMTLPHYGSAPIGWCLLLEPESYRSATMALRDQIVRLNEPVKFLTIDNGKAFNNTTFDQLVATLGVTKINRCPRDPRFASEIEALFRIIDREVIHNLAGNTKPLQQAREMSSEMHPNKNAVWTFQALYDYLESYLFTLLWDAPSATLGTTPRQAFERDQRRAPDREGQFVIPPEIVNVAFLPEVKGRTRLIQPGRGVYVEGYYYWDPQMQEPGVENTRVAVRYDPYELSIVYAAIGGKWIECIARRAPELRNVTERTQHLQVIARRCLRNTHGKRREASHGRKIGELASALIADEKLLLEQRRSRAQQHAIATSRSRKTEDASMPSSDAPSTKPTMPKVDFSHLRKNAA